MQSTLGMVACCELWFLGFCLKSLLMPDLYAFTEYVRCSLCTNPGTAVYRTFKTYTQKLKLMDLRSGIFLAHVVRSQT
jgi:hypothetical protein